MPRSAASDTLGKLLCFCGFYTYQASLDSATIVTFTPVKTHPLKNAEFSECVSTGQDYCNFLLFCRQNMRGRIVFLANVTTLGCIVGKLAWQTPRKTVFEFLDLSWGGNVGINMWAIARESWTHVSCSGSQAIRGWRSGSRLFCVR